MEETVLLQLESLGLLLMFRPNLRKSIILKEAAKQWARSKGIWHKERMENGLASDEAQKLYIFYLFVNK